MSDPISPACENPDVICLCEAVDHPKTPYNPPGRAFIAYRVGAYGDFRAALLRALLAENGKSVEKELAGWSPKARDPQIGQTDLALQMVEWFAYLADVLTFYNERIATESYLGTATQAESVRRLIRVLGYRPRPGIAATGTVAALSNSRRPITVPQGFQIQSKPGPGQEPQIFEVDAETIVQPLSIAAVNPPDSGALTGDGDTSVLLSGVVTTLQPGNVVLLLRHDWTDGPTQLRTVQSTNAEKDPHGKTNTRVIFTEALGLTHELAADYQLFRSVESAKLYSFEADTVIANDHAVLESLRRSVAAGDMVVFHLPGPADEELVTVTETSEVIFFANTSDPADPTQPPNEEDQPAVPIPATKLTYASQSGVGDLNDSKGSVIVRLSWQEVGQLIAAPAGTMTTDASGSSVTVTAAADEEFPEGTRPVLLEDAIDDGLPATGQTIGGGDALLLTDLPETSVTLKTPLAVLLNTLPVSRGKSVVREVLGSGDATGAGQEFVLKKSPLTYLPSAESTSGSGYASTLRVWVSGIEWHERPSFYGQPADARIFVTREDDDAKTHVTFGDGVNGARLPSGTENVVASYRYGSGADVPDTGALSVVLQPLPGLQAIRSPVAAGGGAEPDPREQIRRYAPQSVTTFGRAISGMDYETLAAQTPGVDRARAYWSWDPALQRTLVTVYVGDTPAAVQAAASALAGATDPNRPLAVKQATARTIQLTFTLVVGADRVPESVAAGVRSALLDEQGGLFGREAVRIGQAVYRSEIYEACMAVPGVTAVHDLQVAVESGGTLVNVSGARNDPGEGLFFQLDEANLIVTTEAATYE